MRITFLKSKGFPFSIDKYEVYHDSGFMKIKRKVNPKFDAFISKDFNDVALEDLTWIDEVDEEKKMKFIKNALAYLYSYYSLPKRVI